MTNFGCKHTYTFTVVSRHSSALSQHCTLTLSLSYHVCWRLHIPFLIRHFQSSPANETAQNGLGRNKEHSHRPVHRECGHRLPLLSAASKQFMQTVVSRHGQVNLFCVFRDKSRCYAIIGKLVFQQFIVWRVA